MKTIIRVLDKDLENLKAVFPYIECPFCFSLLFATPQGMVKSFGSSPDGFVYYACSPCGQEVGYDPRTGKVWQASEDTRTPWPGLYAEEVNPTTGEVKVLVDTRPKEKETGN
jgi:hypothetical protein